MKVRKIELELEHDGQAYGLVVDAPAITVQRCFRITGAEAEEIPRAALTEATVWPHIRNALAALRRAFPGGVV